MTNALTYRRLGVALGALALGGLAVLNVSAQAPSGSGRQKLTFVALGADGQPLADLKPAQIDLKVDGKARQVQALELVKLPAGAAPEGLKALFDNPIPPPYGENLATPSRAIMVAVDEASMRPGGDKPLKDALEQFAMQLGPNDRAGLATMPQGTVRLDPTANRAAFKEAVAKIGGRLPPNPTDDEDRCHARDVLDALSGVMSGLGEGPTSVVVFSSGMVPPGASSGNPTSSNTSSSSFGSSSGSSSGTSSGNCQLTSTEFEKVKNAAAAAHATVYIVLPETSAVATNKNDTAAVNMAGLQNLGGAVNSAVLNLAGTDPPLTKVVREAGTYYVAQIDVDPAERDGRSHRIDLKVTAPGAAVRAPTEVTFAKADAKAAKPVAKDLAKDGKIYTDLPIRVLAFVSRGQQDKVKLVALLAPVDPAVKFATAAVSFLDPNGKGSTYTLSAEELAKPMILVPMELAPGNWRVHAAAVDAAGRAGSADYQADATLTPAGPMKMSGLSLGVNGPTGFSFKTAFNDEPEVMAYFELYGTTQSGLSVAVELAETPDGPAIKTGDFKLGATTEKDKFICLTTFDVKDLKPGDYVVRATFTVQDTPPGKIFRTLRKLK